MGTIPTTILFNSVFCIFNSPPGDDFEGWLHVLYRMAIVLACVLYTIVAALWVVVGVTAAIPPSDSE